MTHILDRLVGYNFGESPAFGEMLSLLSSAEMILADNVYRYFFDNDKWVQGNLPAELTITIDMESFPNVAPPFETFFVGCNSLPSNRTTYMAGGVLFAAVEIGHTQAQAVIEMIQDHGWGSRAALRARGVRWVLYTLPLAMMEGGQMVPPCQLFILFVNADGSLFHGGSILDEKTVLALAKKHDCSIETAKDVFQGVGLVLLPAALLTLSFMHCRNVEIIEQTPKPKQSAKRERKRGHPLIRFRTLQIEPIKRVLRQEGDIESSGLGVALHKCRGHFKDYRDGKGLFGKHKDLYFWVEQERGNADLGHILKDYQAPLAQA